MRIERNRTLPKLGTASVGASKKRGTFEVANDDSVGRSGSGTTSGASLITTPTLGTLAAVNALASLSPVANGGAGGKHASKMLDVLDQLRMALLTGRLSKETLGQLVTISSSIPQSEINDPKLSELIDDIDLRARVELAKLRRNIAAE